MLFVDDGVAIGEIGPLCVVIWRKTVIARRVQQVADGLAHVVRQNGRAGVFIVIEASSDPPEEELRRELSAIVSSHGNKLKCIASTIEATGFRAAFIRSVLSSIALLDRRPNLPPRAFFANVAHAVDWLRPHLPLEDDFLARVEELRAKLGPLAS